MREVAWKAQIRCVAAPAVSLREEKMRVVLAAVAHELPDFSWAVGQAMTAV